MPQQNKEDNASFFRFFNGFCFQSDWSITHADRDFDRKVTRRNHLKTDAPSEEGAADAAVIS